jgi:hypothetical protein
MGGKNYVRRRRKIYLIPLICLLKRYVRQEAKINQIAKKTPEEMGLEDGVVGAVNVAEEEHGEW